VTGHPNPLPHCQDCTTCNQRCACPGCTAPTVQLVRMPAQPSPDLPDSLRRDRLPVGEDLYREAAEAYQAAFPNPVGGSSVALTAADMRLRAAVDRVVELTEQRVRAELAAAIEAARREGRNERDAYWRASVERDAAQYLASVNDLVTQHAAEVKRLTDQRDASQRFNEHCQTVADNYAATNRQLAADLAAMEARTEEAEARFQWVDITQLADNGTRIKCCNCGHEQFTPARPLSSTETGVQATVEGQDGNGPQDDSGGAA
jgi:hypothetical protein